LLIDKDSGVMRVIVVMTWSEFERDREMMKREKRRRLGVGVSGFFLPRDRRETCRDK